MYKEHLAPELKIPDKEEKQQLSDEELRFRIELLRERIYGTITMLAVLISIVPHEHPFDVIIIIGGTSFSLWAASIIAENMSRKIILGRTKEPHKAKKRRFAVHAPLLGVGVFPIVTLLFAVFDIIPTATAVIISISGLFLFLMGISYLSARTLKTGKFNTFLAMGAEFLIGVVVIGVKLFVKV
jgi:hypothetical protein